MTEFDFDELDKAVNSVMSNVDTTKRDPALDDPQEKVVALTLTKEPTAKSQDNLVPTANPEVVAEQVLATDLEPKNEPEVAAAIAAPASLAVKRRGQFMDMIHPSSDMKNAPRPVRREAAVISPTTTVKDADALVEPKQVSAPEPIEDDELQSAVVDDTFSGVDEPQSSPFLPGTKPVKRPLGGTAAPEEPAGLIEEDIDDAATELQVAPAPEAEVLPEELSSDVMAVESNDLSAKAESHEPQALIEATSTPDETPEEIAEPKQTQAQTPAGGSIAQQYTEAPSTGDQTSGSIYDTANYHQAIEAAAAPKKHSTLKWIILSIILLVVGGGAGVGYFLLTH